MALNSSNSNAGSTEPKIGAGALSNFNTQNTENKSNGNFSGGDINFDTSKLSINNPFNTNNSQQPTFNLDDVFTPTVSGNLDINKPSNNSSNNSSNNTTYSNNSTEPTMTVDEVYGKSNNQPVVEKQGDYATSSNEKSKVETSTFGKQDKISVTPTSVTENKGMIGNGAIQSVEGLDFQQKDKASVDVLDSKKKRDEAEAEDKADSMRLKLKGDIDKAAQQEGGDNFKIGDRDEDVANAKAKVDQLTNEKAKYENEYKKNVNQLEIFNKKVAEKKQAIEQEDADYQAKKTNAEQLDSIGRLMQGFGQRYQEIANKDPNVLNRKSIHLGLQELKSEVTRFCEQLGVEPPAMEYDAYRAKEALEEFQSWGKSFIQENFNGLKDFSPNSITVYKAGLEEDHLNHLIQFTDELDSLAGEAKLIENRQEKLQGLIADNKKKSTAAQKAYDDLVNNTYVGEEAPQSGAETSYEQEKKFNEENAKRQAQLEQKKKAAEDAANKSKKIKQDYEQKKQELDETRINVSSFLDDIEKFDNEFNKITDEILSKPAYNRDQQRSNEARLKKAQEDYKQSIENAAAKYNLNIELKEVDPIFLSGEAVNEVDNLLTQKEKELDILAEEDRKASKERYDTDADYRKSKKDYNNWKKAEEEKLKAGAAPEPETPSTTEPQPETPQSGAETSYNDAMNAIKNSENATPEQKAQAEEAITNLEDSRKALAEAAAKARSGNPDDMDAYQKALETYNKNLKEAQKIGNRWTQTDFNKDYTRAVAQANDFKVTLADGTEMEYSDFATEEATKSPQYAKAMYEKKAAELEEKHPILAKIERWKAEWSQTWLGSKLTFADNKVRDQFNQMAKTDMRATYAAYNNVLNDETGKYSEADKAEASKAINQAKALMTASAALQASTGFLSGIGDSMEDGISGTTDPGALNAWQKTLNTVDNIIRITLGLGISPAANKAYQNMYYMAGDKVNNSLLFNKDFDSDGFVLCQEYGNNAATGMIAGAGELAVGIAMMFNPASMSSGLNLITDSVQTFLNGLYGVRNEAEKSQKYTQEVLEYFKEAEDIAESSGNEEAVQEITNAITQIENFELKSDEVGNIDNWLEGSGSNTASNEKFNQSLTYDEWLKLIEADPTMREFAKSLTEKKKDKNAQKDNADTGVNS